MAELQVQLSADIKRIISDLNKVQNELKDTGNVAEKQNTKLARSFTKVNKGTANAVPTLQEFSRVIQDAPFGIQGVANNIQQLTANFGNLSRSAGGSRAALKLMLGALSGPGGVLLAVSAVTAFLVQFGDELFSSANKADKLKESLQGINDAFDAELALNKANEKSLELQGQSTRGILAARNEILKRQISQVSLLIEEQKELLGVQREANRTVTIFEALGQVATGLFDKATAFAEVSLKSFAVLGLQAAKQLGIEVDLSKFRAASAKDKEKERDLEAQLNRLLAQKVNLENDILESLRKQNEQRRVQIDPVQSSATSGFNPISGLSDTLTAELPKLGKVITEKGQESLNSALLFQENMAGIFSSGNLANAISQTFNSVGQALANGANLFSALGAGIIGAFGNFLSEFGQRLIKYGLAAKAFAAVSAALSNPVTAAPAAAAAIAIGAVLSAAGGALSSAASQGLGNTGFSGSSGSFQGSNTSFSSFSSSSGNGGTVVFEIQGRKLVGVLNRELAANSRIGGNLSIG